MTILALFAVVGCGDNSDMPTIDQEVHAGALSALSEKRIYFGHQSVGANILGGVDGSEHLTVSELEDVSVAPAGTIVHNFVGTNGQPRTKIEAFEETLADGVGESVDIAFFKFCYTDIAESTDLEKLFEAYRTAMERIEAAYPETTFVYVTTPVSSRRGSFSTRLKDLAKRAIGRADLLSTRVNAEREAFNDLMRAHYGSSDRLFDLALAEASAPGKPPLRFGGREDGYLIMRDEYAADYGHLNERGSRYVAARLLEFLAGLAAPEAAHGAD